MARAVLLAFAALFLSLPLQAADAPAARPRQVPLTARLVERFIASYEPVKALNEKYERQWGDEDFADPHADGATQMRQSLETHGALDEFNALVAQYGFKGVEDWWPVAYSTMIAYGFSDPAHDAAKAKAGIERALAELDSRSDLPAAQKAKYRAALKRSLANYEAMKPPPGNIAAVMPYRAKLDLLLSKTN